MLSPLVYGPLLPNRDGRRRRDASQAEQPAQCSRATRFPAPVVESCSHLPRVILRVGPLRAPAPWLTPGRASCVRGSSCRPSAPALHHWTALSAATPWPATGCARVLRQFAAPVRAVRRECSASLPWLRPTHD